MPSFGVVAIEGFVDLLVVVHQRHLPMWVFADGHVVDACLVAAVWSLEVYDGAFTVLRGRTVCSR